MARVVRIGFLGNCFVFGYRGVPRRETYPEVMRRRLEAERPGVRFTLTLDPLYHPADLSRQVGRALTRPPDILVIDTAANLIAGSGRPAVDVGALPGAVAVLAEGARLGRSVAKGLVADRRAIAPVVDAIERTGRTLVDRAGLPFLRRHGRPTVDDYERLLHEAITQVSAAPKTTLIVQGPSAFNADESDVTYRPRALDIYRDVNAMVRRVTAARGTVMVDRQGVASGAGRSIFVDGNLRLSRAGHEMMGQALAETILNSGIM